jgi:hypothetical protein
MLCLGFQSGKIQWICAGPHLQGLQSTVRIALLLFGLDNVDAHQRNFMRFGAVRPKWRASNEIGAKSF